MSIQAPIYEDPVYTPAPPEDPFGPILSGFEIEQALAGGIRTWLPDYLLELERRRSLPPRSLPAFRTEVPTSFDADRLREDQLPALAIMSAGLTEPPQAHNSDGSYTAKWRVDCISSCVARGNRQARRLAQWYTAAVRAILLQWDFSGTDLSLIRIDWVSERYSTRSPTEERTMGEGVVSVDVHATDVMYRSAGPMPMFKPGAVGDLAEALTHDIVVQPEED